MRDRDLYAQILGITAPWHVSDVRLDEPAGTVAVVVGHRGPTCCAQCGKARGPGYDSRLRRWLHLDTCQPQTVPVAEVPRVECPDNGVVIDWPRGASFSAVAPRLGLTWDEVVGIMARAVERGLGHADWIGRYCRSGGRCSQG